MTYIYREIFIISEARISTILLNINGHLALFPFFELSNQFLSMHRMLLAGEFFEDAHPQVQIILPSSDLAKSVIHDYWILSHYFCTNWYNVIFNFNLLIQWIAFIDIQTLIQICISIINITWSWYTFYFLYIVVTFFLIFCWLGGV